MMKRIHPLEFNDIEFIKQQNRFHLFYIPMIIVLTIYSSNSFATPIDPPPHLKIMNDSPGFFEAEIDGMMSGATWSSQGPSTQNGNITISVWEYLIPVVGVKWHAWGQLEKVIYRDMSDSNAYPEFTYNLFLYGRHMVALHNNETAPNTNILATYFLNLRGISSSPSLQKDKDSVLHPHIPHNDSMQLTVYDMDDESPSYLWPDGSIFSVVKMYHTPEPCSILLFGSGISILFRFVRKKG
ncbi:MAG: hypothetical protein GXP58_02915 [Deltaproteobacteria bacterium]|nr:hypothetical protein [Deltaproteobacteria bacterium]